MRYRALTASGDYQFGNGPGEFFVNTPAAVAQAVQTRLLLWQGEWFADTSLFTPWSTQILGKGTDRTIDAAIQTVILNTPGVNQLTSYSSSLNRATRHATVVATITTIYGTISTTFNI